jgi:tubulin beta
VLAARGHYTAGAEFVDPVMEALRREAEICDFLEGFQLTHSLGEGTGSGFGRIREEYPSKVIATYSVAPSNSTILKHHLPNITEISLEYYNALLAICRLSEDTDVTHVLDNRALHRIACRTQGLLNPTIEDINHQFSLVMSGLTTSFRFPGLPLDTVTDFACSMPPYTNFRFLVPSFAPLTAHDSQQYCNRSANPSSI